MFRIRRQLRSNDFDIYGHLNQSVYHVLLEDARIAFVFARLPLTFTFVAVRSELDYRREVPLGETEVDIGVELARIGRSSFALKQTIWRMDGELAAEGLATFAVWNAEARASRPITDEERALLTGESSAA